ncbi:GAP family protein [Streptomyces sp. NPDC051109]|uniref:GAP family protein n=1 Tax=Streptomyces sp. NPDC051109 TaxID=3365642 RepID=UPI001066B699
MVLDLLLIGLAIALDPIPVTAFILLLSAERGVRKGLVFLLAWLACLVVVLALVVFATGGTPPAAKSAPSTAALAGKLVIGVGLVAYGERKRRALRRPRTQPRKPPAWAARLNEVSYWTAAGLAVLVQPWGLVAAGCATVVDADMSEATTVLTLFGFCLLASAGLLGMELYATFAPEAARDRLGRLRAWMEDHQDQTIVSLSLLIGLWLVGKSIYQLTA